MTQICVQPLHALLLDDEITALALQLEEISIGEENGKGKHPVGDPPDTKCAFDSFKTGILAHLTFLKDLKLAHSIAHAVDTDAQAIAELTQPEEQAQEDRRYAIRLSSETSEDEPYAETPTEHPRPSQQAFQDTEIHSIRSDEPDDEPQAGPSVTYADRQARALDKFSDEHQCSVCFGDYRAASMFPLPCGDRYCVGCLKTLFLNATTDETLFPPRCCRQPIPLQYIQRELSIDELNAFHNSAVEFSTKDRTYCSNLLCGKFIHPTKTTEGRAECPVCFTETCTTCKAAFHEGSDCPADSALQATILLASEQGWQRCYACRAMVELDYGCNHMTCALPFAASSAQTIDFQAVANAVPNFAIPAAWTGSTVLVTSGTKNDSSSEPEKLSTAMHHSSPDWNSIAVSIRCAMCFVRIMNVRITDGFQELKVGMGKCSVARCARDGIGDLFCNVRSVMCIYVRIVGAIACDEC